MPTELHPSCDRIHIEQLEVSTHIGVPEEERRAPQRLTASISFWPYQEAGDLADKIENAINYSDVVEETQNFVRDQSVNLIETLADRLAMHLLKNFRMQRVTIELRKFPFKEAKYVSMSITRTACVE